MEHCGKTHDARGKLLSLALMTGGESPRVDCMKNRHRARMRNDNVDHLLKRVWTHLRKELRNLKNKTHVIVVESTVMSYLRNPAPRNRHCHILVH